MDRNTKIALSLMAVALVHQGYSLRKLAHINNTNVDVYRRAIDVMERVATEIEFQTIVNNLDED